MRKQFYKIFFIDIAYIFTKLHCIVINAESENLQYPLYKINDPVIAFHLTTIYKKLKPWLCPVNHSRLQDVELLSNYVSDLLPNWQVQENCLQYLIPF